MFVAYFVIAQTLRKILITFICIPTKVLHQIFLHLNEIFEGCQIHTRYHIKYPLRDFIFCTKSRSSLIFNIVKPPSILDYKRVLHTLIQAITPYLQIYDGQVNTTTMLTAIVQSI